MPDRSLHTTPRIVSLRRSAWAACEREATKTRRAAAALRMCRPRWHNYAPDLSQPVADLDRYQDPDMPQRRQRGGGGAAADECEGDRRLRGFFEALSALDKVYRRSEFQKDAHRAMAAAFLPQMYGAEFTQHMARLLEEHGLDEVRKELLIACPRRFGKTLGVAMASAAFLCSQPGKKVCIYSPSRRASKMMLATIYNMVKTIRGDASSVVVMNQEELSLSHPNGQPISTCNSYPSNVRQFYFIYIHILLLLLVGRPVLFKQGVFPWPCYKRFAKPHRLLRRCNVHRKQ